MRALVTLLARPTAVTRSNPSGWTTTSSRPPDRRTAPGRPRRRTVAAAGVGVLLALGLVAQVAAPADAAPGSPGAGAPRATTDLPGVTVPELDWQPCRERFECATATVPLDYDRPRGETIDLPVIRYRTPDTAHRIGSVFLNPGGPGGSGIEFLATAPAVALGALGPFDLVSWDPRGVGQTGRAVDCRTDAEDEAAIDDRFVRPAAVEPRALVRAARTYVEKCIRRNPGLLPHLSTADTARDLDVLRAAVGDERLTYFGLSYGTFLGATYSSLFPHRVRAMVADAPVDPSTYVSEPVEDDRETLAGLEDTLARWAVACAAAGERCAFGGRTPLDAFDDLVAAANEAPVPAPSSARGAPVSGDDLLLLSTDVLLFRSGFAPFAEILASVAAGDASLARDLVDEVHGRRPDGTWQRDGQQFAIRAADQHYPRRIGAVLGEGAHQWRLSPHYGWVGGYSTMPFAVYPFGRSDAYAGPFRHPRSAAPALVIAGTHDPRTPYAQGVGYAEELGNTRLLTFRADGHGAIRDLNVCVVSAINRYLTAFALPAEGAVCDQGYEAFPEPAAASRAARAAPLGERWTTSPGPGRLPG